MAVIKQLDKRSGITYIYESKYVWDKERKQSRSVRRLIGRLDAKTGEIIETDGRRRGGKALGETLVPVKAAAPRPKKSEPAATVSVSERKFCGATCLLDAIGEKLGLVADLKACFPKGYKMILSIAYYLILEDSSPLFRFGKWHALHTHPYGGDIPSRRSSELFASITEDAKTRFFRLQGLRRAEDEYLAYDTSSISSYSEQLSLVKYGKNKDYDPLPQINLLLVFGEESYLPFYYRRLAGNIPDVKTVKVYLRELDVLGYSKVKVVKDRGFYSVENINALYKNHIRFVVGGKTGVSFVRDIIAREGPSMRRWDRYNGQYGIYVHSETVKWDYEQERPYKGDVLSGDRRMYLHLYHNPEKALEDEMNFNRMILSLKSELLSGERKQGHERLYAKYFDIKETQARGVKITVREDACEAAKTLYGYFVLLSNDIKDPIKALQIYRSKDVVEKAFGNIKERLGGRGMLVSSEASLEGKLFVQFVALIYLSYIRKHMIDKRLFDKYTLRGLLDELDLVECFRHPGKEPYIGEMLDRQRRIYLDMDVPVPANVTSLCIDAGM